MPVSQMRNGLTAENSIFSQKPSINVSRSRFDYSRFNVFSADIGAIYPVDCFITLPNDDFDLFCQYKIDFRPLLVPSLTSYKVKVHYFWCPMQYLWSGWETFISKGRSGNLALTVPQINVSELCSNSGGSFPKMDGLTDENFKTADGTYYPYSAGSLLGMLLGSVPYDSNAEDSGFVNDHYLPYIDSANTPKATGFKSLNSSALPFLMYQKIYRSNYCDPNLFANNKVENKIWFPEDIDSTDWRINYAGTNIGGDFNHLFVPQGATIPDSIVIANFVPKAQVIGGDDGDNAVNLTQLRFAMYTDDMFTTALPFLQRGNQTELSLDLTDTISDFYLGIGSGSMKSDGLLGYAGAGLPADSVMNPIGTSSASGQGVVALGDTFALYDSSSPKTAQKYSLVTGDTSIIFTAQQLRNLLALSIWQERNALTNGSYGQFIKVHFGNYPDNQYCEPIYVGGTTSVFDINAIVQTSSSTDSSSQGFSPQGNPSGLGGSSNRQGIGSFRARDWGIMMVLMTVIPDTVYVQNQEHMFFDVNPDDFYMPEYEKLSYQPILNKQLFVSGDDSVDNDLFGYSNRYVYLKQRDTVARGRIGLPADIDAYYHAYVQSRIFVDTPQLSQQFVTVYPPNIDRNFLAYPGEPAFIVQFYSGVNAVRPLSYVSQPNTFGF